MFRHMGSVVRTVRQNLHKNSFSTTTYVQGMNFEKNLSKLQSKQLEAQVDRRPTFIRGNLFLFTLTSVVGVISTGLTIQTLYEVLNKY